MQGINPNVEPYMDKIALALDRHLERGAAWTEIYNRAYEAVWNALNQRRAENEARLLAAVESVPMGSG